MLQPMFGSDYSRIEYNRLASQAFMMLRVQQRCYADVEANVQERSEVRLAGMKVPSGDSGLRSMIRTFRLPSGENKDTTHSEGVRQRDAWSKIDLE